MKMVTVGDFGKIITGKTPPTKDKDNYGGSIPFVTPVDMVGNRNAFITERYVSKKGLATVKNCLLPEHAICVSCIGSDMGKAVLTVKPSVTNQQINSIIVDADSFDYLYVYYLMRTLEGIIKSLGKNGTAVPILNKSKFSNIGIMVFEKIERQKAISSILSAYDNLIENNQKQIKLLEEAAQRLYKEWFIDLRFPGHENTPIVDGVPEGWKIANIGSLCSHINAGGTPSRSNKNYWDNPTVKWYKTGELQDCWLLDSDEMISQEGLERSSAKTFPQNTILMAIYASPTLGRLGVLSSTAACNQAALCLLANEEIVSWQWLYSKLYELRDDFNAVAKGAGQQNISAETVKKKEVVLPPRRIINGFTVLVSPMYDERLLLQKQIRILSDARDRMLPKLMNGEIEV